MSTVSNRTAAPLSGPIGQLVASRRDELRCVLRDHGFMNARVFGSVARGDEGPHSDVDLLVDLPAGISLFDILRLREDLERVLGVVVDLVPSQRLKDNLQADVERDAIQL